MANNSTPVSLMQPKTYADANDQFLAWSPASGNDVIVPVQNLFSTVPLVVGTTITVGNSSGVVINTTAIAINGSVIGGGGGYAGGNLVPSVDATATLGNTSHRFANLELSGMITIGNSGGQTTINTTAFSGQSNAALFIGALPAANVVSNAQLIANLAQYQPTVTLGTVVAGLAANAASFIGSLPAASVANNIAPAFTVSAEVGNVANNVFINSTSVKVGNSTINATMNSTSFTGTSNNTLFVGATSAANVVSNAQLEANLATYATIAGLASNVAGLSVNNAVNLNGLAATNYANTSNATITTLKVANLIPTIIMANGTVGLAGQVLLSSGDGANVYWGNSSGGGSGGGPFGNPNQVAYNNAGTETGDQNFTWQSTNTLLTVGASGNTVAIRNNQIVIGNSSGNVSINSTSFSGIAAQALLATNATFATTANNAAFLGSLPAASYANNSAPLITTSVTVGNSSINNSINATSYSGTANAALFIGAISAANVVSNAQLTANLGNYQTIDTLSSAVSALTANNTLNLGGIAAVNYANNSAPVITTTLAVGTTGNNVTANTTALKIGNSTVFSTVNSTVFSGSTNNTLFVGSTSAANVVSNAQLIANLSAYSTITGLIATVATIPANSASFIGTLPAASVANTSAPIIATATFGTAVLNSNNVTISQASITIGNSTINSTITPTNYNGIANNALFLGGLAASNFANTSNAVITTSLEVGAVGNNVTANTTTVKIGNSTIFSTANSTVFSGTANNASNLGGIAASGYANNTGPVFGISANVGANVSINTSALFLGNSTINSTMSAILLNIGGQISANDNVGSAGEVLTSGGTGNAYWAPSSGGGTVGSDTQIIFNSAGTETGDANLTWNTTGAILTVGGAVTNVQITDTSFSGTANNSLNLGGLPATSYPNTTAPVFANSVQVGTGFSNGTIVNSTAVFMGNSTVFGTINTTNYTGTSNNANSLGGLSAGNYPNTSLANILVLTANTLNIGNAISNASVNSTSIVIANVVMSARLTANGSVGTAGLVLTSAGIAGNNYWAPVTGSSYGSDKQIAYNNAGVETGDANLIWNSTTATMTIGNSTIFSTINSTVHSATSNNALNLGGLAAANYPNTSVATFSTSANVGAVSQISTSTVTTGNSTAKFIANSSQLTVPGAISANGSVGTASFVLKSGGTGANAYWDIGGGGGGTPGGLNTQIQFNSSGSFAGDANLTWTTATGLMVFGNSTVNSTINSTFHQIATVNATALNTVTVTATGNISGSTLTASANLNVANLATFGNSTVFSTANSSVFSTNGVVSVANSVMVKAGSITINNAIVPTMGMVYGMLCGYAMT